METDKIDKIARDAFKTRVIEPSGSAWERMSNQLDVIPHKSRNNWLKALAYAASVLLIISVAFFMNTDDVNLPIIPNEIVVQPIDSTKLKKHDFKTVAPVQEAIVKSNQIEEAVITKKRNATLIKKKQFGNKDQQKFKQPTILNETRIALVDKKTVIQEETIKKTVPVTEKVTIQTRIKVDSNALLYAVTHTDKELQQYYAKYKVDRADVLKTIENQLQKMNLKIDPKVMLAEVEKTIGEDSFKRNFMRTIKGKVAGLAIAFSNRNN